MHAANIKSAAVTKLIAAGRSCDLRQFYDALVEAIPDHRHVPATQVGCLLPNNGVRAMAVKRTYRAIFISDVHLGMRNSKAEELLDFLKFHQAETYYLVGDIIDFWKFGSGLHWPQAHNDILQKLLRRVRKGARIVFIPGNHDDGFRRYAGMKFGGIEIRRQAVHVTTEGRRYLVLHGDEFDSVMRIAPSLAFLGDKAYDVALWMNIPLNFVRRQLGRDYWSLSGYLKGRVKRAVSFISGFEQLLVSEAMRRNVDGVVCGHIHQAADRRIDKIRYLNCGDWVESCTAVVETLAGEMQVLRWRSSALENVQVEPAESMTLPAPV